PMMCLLARLSLWVNLSACHYFHRFPFFDALRTCEVPGEGLFWGTFPTRRAPEPGPSSPAPRHARDTSSPPCDRAASGGRASRCRRAAPAFRGGGGGGKPLRVPRAVTRR